MNPIRTLNLAMAAVALLGNPAFGQDGGLTREQVKAELAEARRNGELRTGGEAGLRMRDMYPGLYPAAPAAPAPKSRRQVVNELEQARQAGALLAQGEFGFTEYDLAPHRFPGRPVLPGKTREEVKAELALAKRIGDIPVGEDGRTHAERYPQVYAAARAEHFAALKARREAGLARRSVAEGATR